MTFEEYFKSVLGKKIDYDGVYANQCVDLIKDYAKKVLGLTPEVVGDAWEYWTNYDTSKYLYNNFERIRNTPDFIPQKGDIAVFNRNYGAYGHVCVCTGEGDINHFMSYDQNAGGNFEPVQLKEHKYVSLYGVLRPKCNKESYLVVINCDVLRVRKSPTVSSEIVTRVKRNEVYTIIDEYKDNNYTWGRLKSGVGWIALNYTRRK